MESWSSSRTHGIISSPMYMKVGRTDEFIMTQNIRQRGVCWNCVEYLYKLGYSYNWICIMCMLQRRLPIGHLYSRPLIKCGGRHTICMSRRSDGRCAVSTGSPVIMPRGLADVQWRSLTQCHALWGCCVSWDCLVLGWSTIHLNYSDNTN